MIIPEYIDGYGKVKFFKGAYNYENYSTKTCARIKNYKLNDNKVLKNIEEAIDKTGLKDGMTISFHHHLRNGDFILNKVLEEISKKGIKNITVAASSIFPIHSPMIKHIKSGAVTKIITNYMSGPVAEAVSQGLLKEPVIFMTHGGRSRAIECGDLHIDVAFIAAPTSDEYGNINGVLGNSSCGSLGYAVSDAQYADNVVAITDNLVPYPACPIEINQTYVDYVITLDQIGDPKGIVSGTTKVTKDAVGLKIAQNAVKVIEASGLLRDGMSFQTGAGGISLAVAEELGKIMKRKGIVGSFASGGITSYIVNMLKEGCFKSLMDVQCFDLAAVQSYKSNPLHQGMSASMYANPFNKGAVVNKLDIMILGATEIDINFNVNVTTSSNGTIMGGAGGHSDTASGSKLSIVVANLVKARLPIIKDKVITVTTPGETIDVLVTERGIAVNPKNQDLIKNLKLAKLPIMTIQELKEKAEKLTGKPRQIEFTDKIIGVVEYRDGSVIDIIRKVK